MPESGTVSFSDVDDFRDNLRRSGLDPVLTVSGDFIGRLTVARLRHLSLLRIAEERPRVAFVSLAPDRVFVTFSTQSSGPLVWGGVELEPCDIVFHSRGERMHQRTSGPCCWASISQIPAHLAACSKALTGTGIVAPQAGEVLHLPVSILILQLRL